MIPLDSPQWNELKHAYGVASDIPLLLKQLEAAPSSNGTGKLWQSLWGSLCHQGDVYPASYAAVPHLVRILATEPLHADANFFLLPAGIEIARASGDLTIPEALEASYLAALRQIPALVAATAARDWDEEFVRGALAALAAVKGYAPLAESILELDSDTAQQFMDWFYEQ